MKFRNLIRSFATYSDSSDTSGNEMKNRRLSRPRSNSSHRISDFRFREHKNIIGTIENRNSILEDKADLGSEVKLELEKIKYYINRHEETYKFSYDEIKQLKLNGFIDKVYRSLCKISYIVYNNDIYYINDVCLLKSGAPSDLLGKANVEYEHLQKFRDTNNYVNYYVVTELHHTRIIDDIKNYYDFKLLYC